MPKFLIIQTSFIGDVVLTTALIEKLHVYYPEAKIDFLLRKGNEGLLKEHPFINKVLIWDKQKDKRLNLIRMAFLVRRQQYTHVINPHRFFTTGFITFLSGAKNRVGFDKNPFSFCYTKVVKHIISPFYSDRPVHELERNQALIADFTGDKYALPKLYPLPGDYDKIKQFQKTSYICIAPSSVWFTKRYPVSRWIELVNALPLDYRIYLLGGDSDITVANEIMAGYKGDNLVNLFGKINYLQSAALMEGAKMSYANDSGPLHFAFAMNAPVTGVFCSTIPSYGFTPLRNNSKIVEIDYRLYCRPCGIHGRKACPEGHFKCAMDINIQQLLWWIPKTT